MRKMLSIYNIYYKMFQNQRDLSQNVQKESVGN